MSSQVIVKALSKLGLQSGDTVLVHSDLRGFKFPGQLQSREAILQFYQDIFGEVLGKEGTLATPAYFYEYARFGQPFDVDRSPASAPLGSFSQWINSQPNRIRSCNPLQSIAAIGQRAEELAGGTSLSGYGVTSPWHRLRLMKGKILFFGAPLQSMTYVHYIEQQFGVPHLYFKIYPHPVIKDGKQLPGHVISAVRYLDFSVQYDLNAFEKKLQEHGALASGKINAASLLMVDAETAFQIGIACLNQNPYFFLKHPPAFVSGKIPFDGITGPSLRTKL